MSAQANRSIVIPEPRSRANQAPTQVTPGEGKQVQPWNVKPSISVIVPTFKEASNLPVLIPQLHSALQATGLQGEIIVVDDNSPDDTPIVVQALAQSYSVRLETRYHERGLSSAVVHGLQVARGHVLVVMDADLSHPPEAVPELVRALDTPEVDFAIGSRYVAGASTDEGWGVGRWLNSKVATLLARPFTSAKDPMAGFFALRASTFAGADKLDPIGYKIGLELMVKCGCRNIREIPIHFRNRLHGQSKLTVKEQINYLKHLKRLLEYKSGLWGRFLQFGLVGLSGMCVDLTAFTMIFSLLPLAVARAAAILLAMMWNFWWNRRLTFSYARKESPWRQLLLFCGASSVGAVASWSTCMTLCSLATFFQIHKGLAAVGGIVLGSCCNFALSQSLVFRKKRAVAVPSSATPTYSSVP